MRSIVLYYMFIDRTILYKIISNTKLYESITYKYGHGIITERIYKHTVKVKSENCVFIHMILSRYFCNFYDDTLLYIAE